MQQCAVFVLYQLLCYYVLLYVCVCTAKVYNCNTSGGEQPSCFLTLHRHSTPTHTHATLQFCILTHAHTRV